VPRRSVLGGENIFTEISRLLERMVQVASTAVFPGTFVPMLTCEGLIRQRTQAKNRLRSTLHRYNIVPPPGGLFAPAQRTWWEALSLSACEKLRVRQDLLLLDSLEPLIEEVDAELTHLSVTEHWRSQVTFLLQLPGIGVINALVLLTCTGYLVHPFGKSHCYVGESVPSLVTD
jgi:hypothetical protein